jgi:heme A synthase
MALALASLVLVQWVLGLVNLVLLAPTGLQILHLLVADLIWIGLILTIVDASRPA